jgi:hypothetical protein
MSGSAVHHLRGNQVDCAAGERVEQRAADSSLTGRQTVLPEAAMVEADQDHVAGSAAAEAGTVCDAAVGMTLVGAFADVFRTEGDCGPHDRVIHEVLSDRRQVAHHRDAQSGQCGGGTKAGAHQDRW